MSTKGGPVFIFTLPKRGAARPFAPCQLGYATACNANLYDIVANLPEGPPIFKKPRAPKIKFRLWLCHKKVLDSTQSFVTNFQLKSAKSSEILPKNLLF